MVQAIPRTYQQYLDELEQRLDYFEKLRDQATGLDERIDVSNRLLIETVKLLTEGLRFQIPGVKPEVEELYPGMPHYNVRKYPLDTARTEPGAEIDIPGDMITAYTDGTLVGTFIRMDEPANDAIPLNEFNPYKYTAGFKKFWLQTTAQSGKYLRLHIGREASAEASVQITAMAPKSVFYVIESDKDDHFTGSLAQYYKEDENLSGLLSNKIRITGIAILSDQQLKYKALFWYKDTFDNSDLDVDEYCGEVELDLPSYGFQKEGAGKWYLDMRDLHLDYEDLDGTSELHISLLNMSTTAKKTAALDGKVKLFIAYEPRA